MSMTFTETDKDHLVKHIKAVWVSDTDGAASGASTNTYDGILVALVTIPDGGGTAPTALYDVAINDNNSVDVAFGQAVNRSATLTEYIGIGSIGAVSESKLTFAVTNAGEAKGGTIHVWIA